MRVNCDRVGETKSIKILLSFGSQTRIWDEPIRLSHFSGEIDNLTRVVILRKHGAEITSPSRITVNEER
jgi:hypothetical protein